MDTTIILVLVLSALFLGSILWLIIYSRRQKGDAVPIRQAKAPAGKNAPGRRADRGK